MEEILPQFIPWWHWQADWNKMTASLSARTCGVRGREVCVSIRVSDLHKDFPLWLETFCQADRSVCRISHYARLPWNWSHVKDIPKTLLSCEDSLCFFCRSVPVRTVYMPSTWGHPHPRQNLWVWRTPVRKHERRSLRRWECAGTRSHAPAHTYTVKFCVQKFQFTLE